MIFKRCSPAGTVDIRYKPSISVAAPIVVPSITMFAPIRGSPLSKSVTTPLIEPDCPMIIEVDIKKSKR